MRGWWAGLSERDRNALSAVAVVAALFAFWILAWRPLEAADRRARLRLEAARQDLAWMQAAAAEAQRLESAPVRTGSRGNLSLVALAEQSARSSGLGAGFRRAEPVGDDRLRMTFEAVSFDGLIGWLVLLESRYGVTAGELSVDRAGAPGLVDARVLLAE